MSDTKKQPALLAEPTAAIDDAAVSRAQSVLDAKGLAVKLDADTLSALVAAAAPEPAPDEIPVSLAMIAAGRNLWRAQPSASVHVLLPALYRAMEQVRRDEAS
jgi:hypothetical protein